MNSNSYGKVIDDDGNFVLGKNYKGMEENWLVGPTEQKSTIDYLTGEKLPQYSTIIWLPDANGHKCGISVAYESYIDAIENNDEEKIEKLKAINLPLNINFDEIR